MSLAIRPAIPSNMAVLLSPLLAGEIASASFTAEQRLTDREQAAEGAATALQWIETELDQHVRLGCSECVWRACRSLRIMRRVRERAYRRYQKALRRLSGGR